MSINHLNAKIGTMFNDLNSLSSASTLSINNLIAIRTTIFNNSNIVHQLIQIKIFQIYRLQVHHYETK